ncbi:MAG: hypothetical protein GX813_02355 [Erysipelotrichia bacterium]|nr:hypothetical protein [Erysipelotrichia bacterium]
MRKLLNYIASKAKKRNNFEQSEEYHFFIENRHLLLKIPRFAYLYDVGREPFNIFRANIVLYGSLNSVYLENEAENLKSYIKPNSKSSHANFLKTFREIISEQPYFQEGQEKIYIPIFSRALNQIYYENPEKLLTYPYSGLKDSFKDIVVDPFDTYGNEIYDSHFTRLVKIKSVEKEAAFFHYDTNTIYFINDQGRLDASIVLFDRYIRHPNYSHMLERIYPVVDAYFNFDREALIRALNENGFISSHLLHLIRFHDWAKL